jgi:hypothetical protein
MEIPKATLRDFTQDDAPALRYKDLSGRLRASSRHLDPTLSGESRLYTR